MANNVYTPTGNPITSSSGSSQKMRDEFDLIAAGFDGVQDSYFPLSFENLTENPVTHSFVAPFAGTIVQIDCVIDDTFGGADVTLTGKINGVVVTAGILTLTQAGSAEGDIFTKVPAGLNAVVAGDRVEIEGDGAGNATASAGVVIFHLRRS